MAAWRVTYALQAARTAFDARFPHRDRSSDGSIGDAAHQRERSGHNPDDTPGSLPESEDADSIPEVRAIDVDADLGEPGVTMAGVVQAILATPADRERLEYIIYDRRIWTKRSGWFPQTYYGSNPHTSHAHLSGDPAHDDDASPWLSILLYGRQQQMFTIKGSNGLYLVTGVLDLRTGTPVAVEISQAQFADYQSAKITHIEVPYVNPSYYSIQKAPVTITAPAAGPGTLPAEVVAGLRALAQAADAVARLAG